MASWLAPLGRGCQEPGYIHEAYSRFHNYRLGVEFRKPRDLEFAQSEGTEKAHLPVPGHGVGAHLVRVSRHVFSTAALKPRPSGIFLRRSKRSENFALALAHLQLYWPRDRAYLGIVVLVGPRLKCPRADRILGPQTELHCDRVTWGERIEVENSLRRG